MTRKARRLRGIKPRTRELETDPIVTVRLRCVGCGRLTGVTRDERKSDLSEDAKDMDVHDGLCPEHEAQLKDGYSIFVGNDGSVVFKPEATPEMYRGKVVNVDCPKEQIVAAFEEAVKRKQNPS